LVETRTYKATAIRGLLLGVRARRRRRAEVRRGRCPAQQARVRWGPALVPITLSDPAAPDLPRGLGLPACLLPTTVKVGRSVLLQSRQRRRGRGRRHHDRCRVVHRVQQNVSFVIKPLSNALQKAKPNSGWPTMKCANTLAGITICSRRCWPIAFCGTSSCAWGKKAPALTVAQLRTLLDVV
jgi:hypothetical protein